MCFACSATVISVKEPLRAHLMQPKLWSARDVGGSRLAGKGAIDCRQTIDFVGLSSNRKGRFFPKRKGFDVKFEINTSKTGGNQC